MEIKGYGKGHVNLAKAEVTSYTKQVIAGPMTVGQSTLSYFIPFFFSFLSLSQIEENMTKGHFSKLNWTLPSRWKLICCNSSFFLKLDFSWAQLLFIISMYYILSVTKCTGVKIYWIIRLNVNIFGTISWWGTFIKVLDVITTLMVSILCKYMCCYNLSVNSSHYPKISSNTSNLGEPRLLFTLKSTFTFNFF